MNRSLLILTALFVLLHQHRTVLANELSRCCNAGARRFKATAACGGADTVTGGATCRRAASICCLRALLDSKCDEGVKLATERNACQTVRFGSLGGGLHKECCDCCLLAKELSKAGEPCVVPEGFGRSCSTAFTGCCPSDDAAAARRFTASVSVSRPGDSAGSAGGSHVGGGGPFVTQTIPTLIQSTVVCSVSRPGDSAGSAGGSHVGGGGPFVTQTIPTLIQSTVVCSVSRPGDSAGSPVGGGGAASIKTGDRCTPPNMCAHECVDKGGPRVQCRCRAGYSLGVNGRDCVGIFFPGFEDLEQVDTHDLDGSGDSDSQESDTGGSGAASESAGGSGAASETCGESGVRCDVEFERCVKLQKTGQHVCRPITVNSVGCTRGYQDKGGDRCVDINECDELVNVCGAHERCVNSVGSYSCHCMAGFEYSRRTDECIDINECKLLLSDCASTQQCINTLGSYRCRRILSCGTGYYLDSYTEECKDVDECDTGSHNCGERYRCQNTKGSFKCKLKSCPFGQVIDQATGECRLVKCGRGFRPANGGRCDDLDECQATNPCRPFEQCINTHGSFYCRMVTDPCDKGYKLDRNSGLCLDVNECIEGGHMCHGGPAKCINTEGSYLCRCDAGYTYNDTTKRCEDVDECVKFNDKVCSYHGRCENVVGSFRCHCNAGYRLAADSRDCQDVDECRMGTADCEQRCINVPGSFQCICERGYTLSTNGKSCEDIDECSAWQTAGADLCMGGCINTAGSYRCRCPAGYDIQPDGRTCTDVDECQRGECPGDDRICVNTLGSFKCHNIVCPDSYERDHKFKNLVQDGFTCMQKCHALDVICKANHTKSISYQYAALPSLKFVKSPLEVTRVRAESLDANPFYVKYVMDPSNTDHFSVTQEQRIGVVKLKVPLAGPLTQVVRLHMNIYSRTHVLVSHNVALIYVYISPYYF